MSDIPKRIWLFDDEVPKFTTRYDHVPPANVYIHLDEAAPEELLLQLKEMQDSQHRLDASGQFPLTMVLDWAVQHFTQLRDTGGRG